jgi:hypothetical protein
LNVGFYQNTDSREFFKYNTRGTWESSVLRGTPMMRPVFGEPVIPININTYKLSSVIAPNPAHDVIRITNYELRIKDVEIFDIMGRKQKAETRRPYGEGVLEMNVLHFTSGFYIVRILLENNTFETLKLIKN